MRVDVALALPGHALGKLDIRIAGPPIDDGGVEMTASRVMLGSASNPDQYDGHVTALQGTNIAATVADGVGSRLSLLAYLQMAPGPGTATGTVTVTREVGMSLLPRILAGVDRAQNRSAVDPGALPDLSRWAPDRLIDEVERSGLRGRGGAAFPVARKMHAVAARRGPRVLVGNGTEGEPASGKDRLLLTELPHLVLDGAAMALGQWVRYGDHRVRRNESDDRP